jgi:hypothetical protein
MEQSPRHAAQVKEFSFKARTNTPVSTLESSFLFFPNVRVLNAIRANEKFKPSRDTLTTINSLTITRPLNEYLDLTHLQSKVEILSDFFTIAT